MVPRLAKDAPLIYAAIGANIAVFRALCICDKVQSRPRMGAACYSSLPRLVYICSDTVQSTPEWALLVI